MSEMINRISRENKINILYEIMDACKNVEDYIRHYGSDLVNPIQLLKRRLSEKGIESEIEGEGLKVRIFVRGQGNRVIKIAWDWNNEEFEDEVM